MSWANITTSLGDIEVLSIAVNPYNANTVYVGTIDEGIFKTIDGGETWRLTWASAWVNDIVVNPADTLVVYAVTGDYLYGYVGNVFKTTDDGINWTTLNAGLPSPANRYLYAIAMNPQEPNELYLATYGWGVYKTTNGGDNWKWTNLATTSVLNIYVDPDSSGHIYAGTIDEGILMTPDEGVTWRGLDFGVPQTVQGFFSQFMFDPNDRKIAYAAGGPYGLFKSTDGGYTWELTALRGSIGLVNVHPRSSNTLYAGQTGWSSRELYRSTDGGTTWQNLHLINSEGSVEDIVFDPVNPAIIYVAAGEKGTLKTTDGGNTWNTVNEGLTITDPPLYSPVLSLAVRSDSTDILYALQESGIYLTTNGGEHWSPIDSNLLEFLDQRLSARDVIINRIDHRRVYVSSVSYWQPGISSFFRGGLFLTTNNGSTWTRLFDDALDALSSLTGDIAHNPYNPGEIYLSSTYGIVKILDTTITSVSPTEPKQPEGYQLFQNYPNPFNQSTEIKFIVSEPSEVQLKVYDILGREVRTLIKAEHWGGIYTITWDGKNQDGNDLPSGVYFLWLDTGVYTQARKLVLLR